MQEDLGVENSGTYRKPTVVRHWLFISAFFLIAIGLGTAEYRQRNTTGYRRDNLADLVPQSGYANFMKATRLRAEDQGDSAILYLERAIRLDSNYNFSHAFIADLMYKAHDLKGSLEHYELAWRQDSQDTVLLENLAEVNYQLGFSLLQMKKGLAAKPYLEKALELNPNQPLALNYLGMVEQAEGNRDRARQLYQKSLELDSSYSHARENLSALGP